MRTKFQFIILFFLFFVSSALLIAQNLDKRYEYAQSYEQSGDWERAAELYTALYRKDPREEYFQGIVRTYMHLRKFAELETIVAERARKNPSAELLALLGDILWKQSKIVQADSVWDLAIQLEPRKAATYIAVAQAQVGNRLYDQAINTLKKGRRALGDQMLFSEELIQLYGITGQFRQGTQEALRYLQEKNNVPFVQGKIASYLLSEQAIKEVGAVLDSAAGKNDSPTFLSLYEWFLRESRQYRKALEVVRKLDHFTQPPGRAIYDFAQRCFREEEYEVAIDAYQLLLEYGKRSPFYQGALYGTVQALEQIILRSSAFDKDRIEEVKKRYQEIVKQFPGSHYAAESLYRLAQLELRTGGDRDRAEHYLRQVMQYARFDKIAAQAIIELAALYIQRDQLDSARYYYQQAISVYGKRIPEIEYAARYGLAELEYFSGNIDTAKAMFAAVAAHLEQETANDALERIIFLENFGTSVNPDLLASFAKAELRQRQGRYTEAREAFLNLLKQAGNPEFAAYIQLSLAKLNVEQGKFSDALALLESLLSQQQATIFADRILWMQGQIYERLNENEKAIATYSTLIVQYPRSPYVPLARRRIKALGGGV